MTATKCDQEYPQVDAATGMTMEQALEFAAAWSYAVEAAGDGPVQDIEPYLKRARGETIALKKHMDEVYRRLGLKL